VTNILEAAFQKANDQVRVNVQLINAMTDAHLWAETYDRKLTDIFAVESEIAKTNRGTCKRGSPGWRKARSRKLRRESGSSTNSISRADFFGTSGRARTCTKRLDISEQAIAKDPDTRWA